MLSSRCRAGDWHPFEPNAPRGDLAARVFLEGQLVGAVTFHAHRLTALQIVERMTGLPAELADDLVSDSVREIANMIGGHGKRELEAFCLNLGLPTLENEPVPRRRQFRDHVWIPLETDLGWCGIDVGFHPADENLGVGDAGSTNTSAANSEDS